MYTRATANADCPPTSPIDVLEKERKQLQFSMYVMVFAIISIFLLMELRAYTQPKGTLFAESIMMVDQDGNSRLFAHTVGETTHVSIQAINSKAGALFTISDGHVELSINDQNGYPVAVIRGGEGTARILLAVDGQLAQAFPANQEEINPDSVKNDSNEAKNYGAVISEDQ